MNDTLDNKLVYFICCYTTLISGQSELSLWVYDCGMWINTTLNEMKPNCGLFI